MKMLFHATIYFNLSCLYIGRKIINIWLSKIK